jgi:acyl carrier protein
MKTPNSPVRNLFQTSPTLRIASLVIAIALLIGCAVGVWNAFTAPLEKQEKVTKLTYSQRGDFGYSAVLVGNNTLYGNVTLTEKDTLLLLLKIVDNIEGNFSYHFTSAPPVQQVTHTVRVVAILSIPDIWSKEIELVPETVETDSFTVTYPIDTVQLLELAKAIEGEIGIQTSPYSLTITATVRTLAHTDYGNIDELLTQSMSGTLDPTKLLWAKEPALTQTLDGSQQVTVTTPIDREASRIGWSVALGLVLLLGIYIGWNYIRSRPLPVTAAEEEARQAKKKHHDMIVDVGSLPESKAEDMIPSVTSAEGFTVSLNSLDELIKIAENLLKPVLHVTDGDRHIYYIIDGQTRYRYVMEPEADDQ